MNDKDNININIKDLLPFTYAYKQIQSKDYDVNEIEKLVDMLCKSKHITLMTAPSPSTFEPIKKRSQEDKTKIYDGNHEYSKNVTLSKESLKEMLGGQQSLHANG